MVAAMWARMREQRGQISVEWVGVLAVFCALVAALLALHLGGPLSDAVDHTVCAVGSVGKGDCGKDPSPTAPEPTAAKSQGKAATAARTTTDPDGDGLSTARERALGLLPGKADSDGDGVTDGDELRHHTNPRKADSDGDGVDDGAALRGKAADG
jgi:Bacterial TSP3 repeat